jgi:uncharacterized protein YndB with AHSA1/START domain
MPAAMAYEFGRPAPTVFIVRREFAAPRELVWRAWTEPDRLVRWFGPKGFQSTVEALDLRPGGRFRIVMRSDEGKLYPMAGVYREIVPPVRLVYSETSEGLPGGEALVTITFVEREGRTRMTMHTEFATEADRDAAIALGVEGGWRETLERLETLLAGA